AVLEVARSIRLELDCGPTHTRVRVNGHDVSEAIRTMAVSAVTSQVARNQAVRKLLVEDQRKVGERLGSFVTEGRDQGSVVFPKADIKFVLQATLQRRSERRYQELVADGESVQIAEVMDNLAARDQVDAKQWDPLLASGVAVVIDTTQMTIVEVVDRMEQFLRASLRR
ncbi:MAG: (d)CMP kinase, partial [Planctomycetota bacterium]